MCGRNVASGRDLARRDHVSDADAHACADVVERVPTVRGGFDGKSERCCDVSDVGELAYG
jgi:hypothetical protein